MYNNINHKTINKETYKDNTKITNMIIVSELVESCFSWDTGTCREPKRKGTSAVGSRYWRIGEDIADWEE
jgi:nitrite reductase/ring-hydroxylating ferredoxin subunit